ncbi:MAG: tRNA (cytidine(34)-2'-O)-methyltransferase [Actinomycetota bacterium]
MFQIVLFQPEIPPNTGNCMRLAANTGCVLHLIEPLGFSLEDSRLRRAGMDYRDRAVVRVHQDLDGWRSVAPPGRIFALARSGQTVYSDIRFEPGDSFLFGPESVGLPEDVIAASWVSEVLAIPMQPDIRSLNLANAVAIVVYEAWRQHDFGRSVGGE